MRVIFLFGVILGLCGCEWSQRKLARFDYGSFSVTGGTMFSDPEQVTTKELHFDAGRLLGRNIIIEGEIVSVGSYYTHLVMQDDSGRMLVVLTKVPDADQLLNNKNPKNIKVLGTVEDGKKGIPIVQARSIYPIFGGKSQL